MSLQSKGLSRVFSSTTVQKHQFFCAQPFPWSNSSGETIASTIWTFVGKVSLLFNMLSRLVITLCQGLQTDVSGFTKTQYLDQWLPLSRCSINTIFLPESSSGDPEISIYRIDPSESFRKPV